MRRTGINEMRTSGTSITLRDLRIAKLAKGSRYTACTQELDAYLSALTFMGERGKNSVQGLKQALAECMDSRVS